MIIIEHILADILTFIVFTFFYQSNCLLIEILAIIRLELTTSLNRNVDR
jgi:hypothetical protein